MGGRAMRPEPLGLDREMWIRDVSDERLARYERMTESGGAGRRVDGRSRGDGGVYFRDLVKREIERRR